MWPSGLDFPSLRRLFPPLPAMLDVELRVSHTLGLSSTTDL